VLKGNEEGKLHSAGRKRHTKKRGARSVADGWAKTAAVIGDQGVRGVRAPKVGKNFIGRRRLDQPEIIEEAVPAL